ncbi:MAG TPA: cytochrome C oxidase subunit IV family protein [Thermoanaerobaculia bacterium]|nr:cytochrome C oxidase subunit IV family protein [Thermoanaerobaculia bacterium]
MNEHAHSTKAPTHHVSSLAMYFGVFLALMVLTAVTVWVSRIDLGAMNVPVALAVAIVKAALVILFFMHVLHSTRLTWVVVISAFLWLGVLFVLTFSDYMTRHWLLY